MDKMNRDADSLVTQKGSVNKREWQSPEVKEIISVAKHTEGSGGGPKPSGEGAWYSS